MKITIVGGGIGGLTTAIALQQSGQDVTVYESANKIKPVGAGIMMASNAMQIFEHLGIREKIEERGHKISAVNITDAQLQNISVSDLTQFESKYGVYNVAIHRADLQNILAEKVGLENIILSKRLSTISKKDNYTLTFEDGTAANADILIGADGIKSTVRNQLFNSSSIRDTKQRCWRGISDGVLADKYENNAYESWGRGKRFGFVKINEQKVYWYAVVNKNLIKENLSVHDLFPDFHPDIQQIIAATSEDQINYTAITDLKTISKWHDDKTCLIGDAAHATTPNMGQGACQAIEDAYVLGKLFKTEKSVEHIFAEYQKLRFEKANNIVNTSWQIGKVAHFENRLAIWLRDTLLRNLPKSSNQKQFDKIFDIHYPIS